MKRNDKTAISLIVLVITILVLSILAATVIISLNNTNIMGQASETVFKQDMANYKETYEMYVTNKLAKNATFDRSTLNITYEDEEFEEIFGSVPDKYKEGLKVVNGKLVYETEDETEKAVVKELNMKAVKLISKTETTSDGKSPYIGYYVKIGEEYGVIFADLAIGGSGTWDSTTYSYNAVTDKSTLKDYVVSSTEHTDTKFGTHPVLEVTGSTEDKVDRFYVMALSDVTNTGTTDNMFTWYEAAYGNGISDYATVTSTAFGAGKTNTSTMITKWNNNGASTGAYGARNGNSSYLDVWGVVENGWFVPSLDEWGVFASTFGVTRSNYSSIYGLKNYYWSSSLNTTSRACYVNFAGGDLLDDYLNSLCYVRLATTF